MIDIEWLPEIVQAKNEASGIVWGEIFESDAPAIVAEAARIRGVDPPDKDSEEYRLLVEEVVRQGEYERDELKQLGEIS